jgi:hypothetical protein
MSKKQLPTGEDCGRKEDSTTFEMCGWCKYHGSGEYKYNYMIEGDCDLYKTCFSNNRFKWNTPCIFKNYSTSELESLMDDHKRTINDHLKSVKRRRNYIKVIEEQLLPNAVYRPKLPEEDRTFNLDDEVMVYISTDKKWYYGRVRNGYRSGDGCVSFWLKDIGPQSSEESFWGCGVGSNYVLPIADYNWFLNHPEEYDIWCGKAYKDVSYEIAKIKRNE